MIYDMRLSASLLAILSLFVAGCGGSGPVRYDVTGQVTHKGEPVKEGEISFENGEKGYAASAVVTDGKYTLNVPAADYKVVVRPLEEEVGGGPDSPPSLEYKKADDIPAKYRETGSSSLTATVSPGATSFDFDLAP